MNRNILAAVMVVLMVGAGGLVPSVAASDTVQFDGEAADSADQTNTTYIATNTALDNFTVEMTTDEEVGADGSVFFPTAEQPADVELDSVSGSGTADVTIAEDGYYLNETSGTDSVTVESHSVTFNVTTDANESGVDVSEAMPNGTAVLIENPDASEEHHYQVYDASEVVDVTYEIVGADVVINDTAGEIRADGEDATGQLAFHATRNNTTYEDIPLDSLKFEVALDTTHFSDISEETVESVDAIVLEDVKAEGDTKVYTWDIVDADNVTASYDVRVNATVAAGDANDTLTDTQRIDPVGGVEVDDDATFDHATAGGLVAPHFFDVQQSPIVVAVIGIALLGAIIWFLIRDEDPSMGLGGYAAYTNGWLMVGWLAVLLLGLTLAFDFLDPLGVTFDFWSDLLNSNGLMVLNEWTTLAAGIILVVVALGLNVKNSDPTR